MSIDAWTLGNKPKKPGFYAVVFMYDYREGGFPDALEWDGEMWSHDLPIVCYAGPFDSDEIAEKWAWDNDPEL